jgi:hypothetical protein
MTFEEIVKRILARNKDNSSFPVAGRADQELLTQICVVGTDNILLRFQAVVILSHRFVADVTPIPRSVPLQEVGRLLYSLGQRNSGLFLNFDFAKIEFRFPDRISPWPNPNSPRFGIMPKNGWDAFRVSKFDLLSEVDAGHDFGDDFGQKAERGQYRFKVDILSHGGDLATAIAMLSERENKLVALVDEKARMSLVLLPLLCDGTGKLLHLARFHGAE